MAEFGIYETRPVRIQAILYDGKNGKQVREWTERFGPSKIAGRLFVTKGMAASTEGQAWRYVTQGEWPAEARAAVYDFLHERWIPVFNGQWIIRGLEGEFYPCADSTFQAKYRPIAQNKV